MYKANLLDNKLSLHVKNLLNNTACSALYTIRHNRLQTLSNNLLALALEEPQQALRMKLACTLFCISLKFEL